jgi:hypothetical protein
MTKSLDLVPDTVPAVPGTMSNPVPFRRNGVDGNDINPNDVWRTS